MLPPPLLGAGNISSTSVKEGSFLQRALRSPLAAALGLIHGAGKQLRDTL